MLALSSPVYLKTPQWAVALNDSQSYLTGSMYATKLSPLPPQYVWLLLTV